MHKSIGAPAHTLNFPFNSIRNITSPEDAAGGRRVYSGTAPAQSIIALPNDENVRDYIVEATGKKRRTLTSVHRAMFDTLSDDPSSFSIKNGGVVIVARDIEIDESKKTAKLLKPSLINGAQTQGVLKDFIEDTQGKDSYFEVNPKFEIVITSDEELIAEISIARNSQNNVDPLSIAGKRGILDDLSKSMLAVNPAWDIRVSETDGGPSMIDTPKLLQVITALIPPEIWPVKKDSDNPNKVFCYSMRAKCLKDFQRYFFEAHDQRAPNHTDSKAVYDFMVEIAPRAWGHYQQWKTHAGFHGIHLKQGVTRDEKGKITEVADGIVFPILSALSVFVTKTAKGWAIVPPPLWEDKEIIDALKLALKSPSINGNPWNLGKSRDAYTQIFNVTNGAKRMAEKYSKHFGAKEA